MNKRLEIYFDENLRDVAIDPVGLRSYSSELKRTLESVSDSQQRVRLLGELGVHLRTLGDLNDAEQVLREALQIIENHNLGIKWEVQQKVRLGHVLQWKKNFRASDSLFDEVLRTCRDDADADVYLHFALQHAGKNFFDQNRLREALACFEEALRIRVSKGAAQDQLDSTLLAINRTKSLLGE